MVSLSNDELHEIVKGYFDRDQYCDMKANTYEFVDVSKVYTVYEQHIGIISHMVFNRYVISKSYGNIEILSNLIKLGFLKEKFDKKLVDALYVAHDTINTISTLKRAYLDSGPDEYHNVIHNILLNAFKLLNSKYKIYIYECVSNHICDDISNIVSEYIVIE